MTDWKRYIHDRKSDIGFFWENIDPGAWLIAVAVIVAAIIISL